MGKWICDNPKTVKKLYTNGITGIKIVLIKIKFRKKNHDTGGPPLTRKSLTRFPLTRFLAYVCVSGGISVSRGPQYSPNNTNFM